MIYLWSVIPSGFTASAISWSWWPRPSSRSGQCCRCSTTSVIPRRRWGNNITECCLLEFTWLYFQFMDVFRPTPEWGPGDRSQKKLWLEKKRPRREWLYWNSNKITYLLILQMFSRATTIPLWLTPITTTRDMGAITMGTCNICNMDMWQVKL